MGGIRLLHIPAVGEEGTRGSLGQVLLLGGGAALRNCFRGWCSIASWGPFIHAQVERVTHRVVWGLSVCSLPRKPVFPALLHVNQPDLPDTRFADGASWLLLPGSKKRTRESLAHCVSSEFSAPSRYVSLELWVCSIHIVRHASWHHLGMGRAGGRTTCIPAEEATIIHGKGGGLSLVPGGWRLQSCRNAPGHIPTALWLLVLEKAYYIWRRPCCFWILPPFSFRLHPATLRSRILDGAVAATWRGEPVVWLGFHRRGTRSSLFREESPLGPSLHA